MSIAAISSNLVAALRGRAPVAATEPTVAPGRNANTRPEGRGHALVDAVHQVLGIEGEQSPSGEQAVFRFTHALMRELRTVDGRPVVPVQDQPRGHAWGRREWNDLPQRFAVLAAAAAANLPATAGAPTEPVAPTPPTLPAELLAREIPPQPNPVTTNSAALHLMQVPSSHLLEAYVALRKALGEQANAQAAATPRADLAALLERLSDTLASAPAALPAGSVVNLTA